MQVRLLIGAGVFTLALAIVLIVMADDRGSAAISALGAAITIIVGLATANDASPRLLGIGRRLSGAALRSRAIEHLTHDNAERLLKVPARRELAAVDVSAIVRLRGRAAETGSTADLGRVFDSADGRLVLLGEPGAGKSTALIRLCELLLQRAASDTSAPVPLFVSLAGWTQPRSRRGAGKRDPFETWLVNRIVVALDLSHSEARRLRPMVVPVLDGLDEVAAVHRESCSRAIERFLSQAPRASAVISCRSTEFRQLSALHDEPSTAYRLEPLSPVKLIDFFRELDEAHWAPLVAALSRENSEVAAALSTPLMLTVAVTTWGGPGTEANIPPPEVPASAIHDDLWERWIDRAAMRAQDGAIELAVALARSAMASGSSEVRIGDLGDSGTRRAWWVVKGAVAVGLVCWVPLASLALLIIMFPLIAVLDAVSAHLVAPLFRTARERRERTFANVTWFALLIVTQAVALASAEHTAFAVAFTAFLAGALIRQNPVPDDGEWFASWQRDPFQRTRLQTEVLVALGGLVAATSALVVDPELAVIFGLAAMLSPPMADHAGHHWLARGRYRWSSRGGPFRTRVADLVNAGILRRTSDAHRFFHLELHRRLAKRQGPADAYRIENVDAVWLLSRRAAERTNAGDHDGADALFQRAINAGAKDAFTLGLYAIFLADVRDDLDAAETMYQRAIDADPNRAATLESYALFLTNRRQDLDAAEAMYQRAVSADPNRASTLGNYAIFFHARRQDLDAAETMYQRAIDADHDHAGVLRSYAVFLADQRQDFDAADTMYQRTIDAAPRDSHNLRRYADFLAFERQDLDAADTMYKRTIDAAPRDFHNLRRYADFLAFEREDLDAADAMYKRAIDAGDLDDPSTIGNYAILLNAREDLDAADAMYQRAIDADHDHPRNLGNYAAFLTNQREDLDAAETMYKRAIDADPSDTRNITQYASFLKDRRGAPDRALEVYERALDTAPDDPERLGEHALLLVQRGDLSAAATLFARAIDIGPSHPTNLARYALVLTGLDRDASTIETMHKRAIDAAPDAPDIIGNYASFLADVRGDLDAAEAMHRRAIDAQPDHPLGLANYASFLADRRHDLDAADAMYRRAIDADPGHSHNLGSYAIVLMRLGADPVAIGTMYERAIDADAANVYALRNYALFRWQEGDLDEADALYQRTIDADPHHPRNLREYAGFLAERRSDHDAAEALYQRAIEADPDNPNSFGMYALFLARHRRDFDKAQAMYERALDADPDDANTLGNYALLMLMKGDRQEAIRLIDAALTAARNEPELAPLRLEVRFYQWCAGRATDREEARTNVLRMLDEGIRSPGWDLTPALDIAEHDSRPDLDELRRAAKGIVDQGTPDEAPVTL